MREGTRVIRAGMSVLPTEPGAPLASSPVFASTYHTPGDSGDSRYTYGRFHNPTWTAFETALSDLEGGRALVFASGMAAVSAVFGTTLRPGDVLVLPSDSYYTSRLIAAGYFTAIGVQVRLAPTALNAQADQLEGAKLLWIESPSNPNLDVCDIRALVDAAHAHGVLVGVDNTTPTLLGQQPLALGADYSVASDTKSLCGHSDLIMGHVAVRDGDDLRYAALTTWRTQIGAIAGPMEVWLAHRSLETLHLRLARQCENALKIAHFLRDHPAVASVRYPGLPDDPSHAVARTQMQHYGCVVSFDLLTRDRAERFLSACNLIIEATSFGGLHTTAERRARWGGDAVSEGFIRLSAGCEDADDLIEELAAALL